MNSQKQTVFSRPRLKPILLVIAFLIVLVVYGTILVTFRLEDSLMFVVFLPIIWMAFYYPRWTFYTMILASGLVGLWVIRALSSDFQASFNTIIITMIMWGGVCEIVHTLVRERKKVTARLQMSEERYRNLVNHAPLGVLYVDVDGNILEINEYMLMMLGSPSAEDTKALNLLAHPDFIESGAVDEMRSCIREQKKINGEQLYTSIWGKNIHMCYIMTPIKREGQVEGVLITVEDITERIKAGEALRRSEEKYRTLVERINEIIYAVDREGVLTYISSQVKQFAGYEVEEIVGKPFIGFVHADDVEKVVKRFRDVGVVDYTKPYEFRTLTKDGQVRFAAVSSRPQYEDGEFAGFFGVINDVTERKQTEAALLISQNLADLGTLTAGVTHEIKSPLQVIIGLSNAVLRGIKEDGDTLEDQQRRLETIHRNAVRIDDITRSLLGYARESEDGFVDVDLNAIVKDTLLLIEHQLVTWSNIEVATHLEEDIALIKGDRNKIIQVVINLLTNSRDALPYGGHITIESCNDEVEKRVVLKISDDGSGIAPEIQERIFDPFFTTKPIGSGTGLGMTIIKDIVQQHQGEISLTSSPESGTSFVLSFPAVG